VRYISHVDYCPRRQPYECSISIVPKAQKIVAYFFSTNILLLAEHFLPFFCRIFNRTMENDKEPISSVQVQTDHAHYRTLVKMDRHMLISDEPATIGGGDEGPSPQELLLASLGSCTAITLRMYIDRKMWSVDHITIALDLFEADSGTIMERQLNFEGDLSDEQKQRLVQIADACPIHKMLVGKIEIETGLK
jgi:putative redox protein